MMLHTAKTRDHYGAGLCYCASQGLFGGGSDGFDDLDDSARGKFRGHLFGHCDGFRHGFGNLFGPLLLGGGNLVLLLLHGRALGLDGEVDRAFDVLMKANFGGVTAQSLERLDGDVLAVDLDR